MITPEQEEFWEIQEDEARTTVDRLARDGATVVIAQAERPGIGLLAKCPVGDEECFPLDDYALNHDEYRRRWNAVIERIAADDPRVRTFRMDPLLCADPEPPEPRSPSSCDDLVDGAPLRPDGSHVDLERFAADVADRVWCEVIAASG